MIGSSSIVFALLTAILTGALSALLAWSLGAGWGWILATYSAGGNVGLLGALFAAAAARGQTD